MSANHLAVDDLIRIPGAEFLMGQADGRDEERPVHKVALAPFRVCRYPATNAHWEEFRKATGREKLAYTHETAPAASVNWYDAVAFCKWLSGQWSMHVRLPSEAEWELAARGGVEQQSYPWGPEERRYEVERWRDGPEPVGRDEANGFGLFDMCQNVHEWCADWYDPGYYAISPAENPVGPEHGKRRSSRGGAWRHHIKCSRCAARSSIPPEFRYADYGFRVAADG
jgi:formylglycine-generating enzyme required for sulfatase activity